MEDFKNSFKASHYLTNYSDENGHDFVLHLIKSIINTEPLTGCISYEFFLTDSNPDHNIMVEIGRKAFFPDEYLTEEARLTALEPILREAISQNADRAYRLLNSEDSSIIS